jgi:4-hydroxy-tetrahydrodipicolinate synthase
MDMWRAAQRGEIAKGIELHHRMMPLINAVYTRNHPYPIKRAMALAGRPVGPARQPLVPPDAAQESAIRAALAALGLLASP